MKVIIHLGFVKSASSSLQNLWYGTTAACFAGKRPRRSNARFLTEELDTVLRKRIFEPHDADFDIRFAQEAAARIREIAASEGHDKILISYESLSGLSFAYYGLMRAPFRTIASRLVEMWGEDVHFLTIIREQQAFLRSYHSQLVKQGYRASYATFMDRALGRHAAIPISDGPLPHLRYDTLLATARAVGASATWMPFEYLVAQDDALERIAAATGIELGAGARLPEVNKSRKAADLEARLRGAKPKKLSKFDAREPVIIAQAEAKFRASGAYTPLASPMVEDNTALLRRYFGAHNAAIASEGYDLPSLGYLMPD